MKLKLIIIPIVISLLSGFYLFTREGMRQDVLVNETASYQKSIYEWRPVTELSVNASKEFFSQMQRDRVGTIYLTVNDLVDITELPDGHEKEEKKRAYTDALRAYIAEAQTRGIRVEALAGDTTWSEDSHSYLVPLTIQAIASYNSSVSTDEQFSGVQFDIEAYNHEEFTGNEKEILLHYLQTVKSTIDMIKDQEVFPDDFTLGFAIPYWFDGENGNIPEVSYGGKTAYPFYHIADLLDSYPAGYLSLMAYRNTPTGEKGTIAIAQDELTYLEKLGGVAKLMIAQETVNVEPASITFYGKGKAALENAQTIIINAFVEKRAFGGIAIHDAVGYSELEL